MASKIKTATIRPGVLLGLRTTTRGGVKYDRIDIRDGGNVKKWETTRTIEDMDEHERAIKARGKASTLIRSCCSRTSFGLMCPNDAEPELDVAIEAARAIAAEFNAGAKTTRIDIYVIKGRVADDDEAAARAIASDIGDLIAEMSTSIDAVDPKAIREAANRARDMLSILSEEKQQKANEAIAAARKAARDIVRRVEKKGEDVQVVLADVDRQAIERARIAFLDFGPDEPAPAPEAALPAVDPQRFADIGQEVW